MLRQDLAPVGNEGRWDGVAQALDNLPFVYTEGDERRAVCGGQGITPTAPLQSLGSNPAHRGRVCTQLPHCWICSIICGNRHLQGTYAVSIFTLSK